MCMLLKGARQKCDSEKLISQSSSINGGAWQTMLICASRTQPHASVGLLPKACEKLTQTQTAANTKQTHRHPPQFVDELQSIEFVHPPLLELEHQELPPHELFEYPEHHVFQSGLPPAVTKSASASKAINCSSPRITRPEESISMNLVSTLRLFITFHSFYYVGQGTLFKLLTIHIWAMVTELESS